MKFIFATLLCYTLVMLAGAPLSAEEPPPPAATKSKKSSTIVAKLDDCPVPVAQSVRLNGHNVGLSQIKRIEQGGVVLYSFETGSEEGRDQETTYFYSTDGALKRTATDIPLAKAPDAVKAALKKLAGTSYTVDDVELVTESGKSTYKAELESNNAADRKVSISDSGVVLENKEEEND